DGVALRHLQTLSAIPGGSKGRHRQTETLEPVRLAGPHAGPEPARFLRPREIDGALVEPEPTDHLRQACDLERLAGGRGADVRERVGDEVQSRAAPDVDEHYGARPVRGAGDLGGPEPGEAARGVVRLDAPQRERRPQAGPRRIEGAADGWLGHR